MTPVQTSPTLAAALAYRRIGWSVIPVGPDKKPLIRWLEFQSRIATDEEVMAWWATWPEANVGIVTGAVSGLTVVDIDSHEGALALEAYIPKDVKCPTSRTQRGGTHLFFQYHPALGNRVGIIPGTDLRGEGGYVVAPPSKGKVASYTWVPGKGPDTPRPTLPLAYVNKMLDAVTKFNPEAWHSTDAFSTGRRNDTIFHAAMTMGRGGMQNPDELYTFTRVLADGCKPPLEDTEVKDIVRHVLERLTRTDRNIAADVHDWVAEAEGEFGLGHMYGELDIKGKDAQALARQTILRLVDSKVLTPHPTKRGFYRRVQALADPIDWTGAPTDVLPVKLPFDLHEVINVYPGNVIVVAGEANVGKTAFMLETLRLNMADFPVDYYSSEMGGSELKNRILRYNLPLDQWRFNAYERAAYFADVIQPGRISLVDYMELGEDIYRVGKYLQEIHAKLNGTGLAVVAIQKGSKYEVGRGGDFGMEKPRLYVTMSRTKTLESGIIKIVKAKNWKTFSNPNGKIQHFTIQDGCHISSDGTWHYESDEDDAKRSFLRR